MRRSLSLSMLLAGGLLQGRAQSYNAEFVEYLGLRYVCEGEVVPVVRILNAGSETMTGCVVDTWKNGLMVNSFNWQLAVAAASGQSRTPALPVIQVEDGDELEFHIITVNGVADEVAEGNILPVSINTTPSLAQSPTVRVEVLTDGSPEETSWVIRGANYQVVASGGPYAEANTTNEVWATLDPDGCYVFEVNDTGGDGFSNGHARLYSLGNEVIGVGTGVPFFRVNAGVVTGNTVSIAEQPAGLTASLFPSPTNGPVTLHLRNAQGSLRLGVFDNSGRAVLAERTIAQSGSAVLDLSALEDGRYHVRLQDTEGRMTVAQVVIAH